MSKNSLSDLELITILSLVGSAEKSRALFIGASTWDLVNFRGMLTSNFLLVPDNEERSQDLVVGSCTFDFAKLGRIPAGRSYGTILVKESVVDHCRWNNLLKVRISLDDCKHELATRYSTICKSGRDGVIFL